MDDEDIDVSNKCLFYELKDEYADSTSKDVVKSEKYM